jgi:ribosomal protein S18 acetylase RimI-like enzyme
MTFDHRPFQEADSPTICTFPRSAEELSYIFPKTAYPLASSHLAAAARQCHDPTVGLLDGRITGYIGFLEVHARKFCTIGNLVVHPEFRREGMGSYLVGIMVQRAFEHYAVRFVRASCLSHNRPAYTMYHNLGFRPADMGQRLGPDGDPVLVIDMHLPKRNWKA